MTNYATGHAAEKLAADYLKANGFKIIELNWRTPVSEIDIIAQKNKTIYFIEVKSRKNTNQGSGLEYITPRKLKQMRFSAEMWVHANKWNRAYQLAAISLDNREITFVDEL